MPEVWVSYSTDSLSSQAELLAQRLNLPLTARAYTCEQLPKHGLFLYVTENKLTLASHGFCPLFVDFSSTAWQIRRAAGKQQGLIRAVKPSAGKLILDATAGWGREAAILASFGAQVMMFERNPVMAALLADGLQRLDSRSPLSSLLSLVPVDTATYLNQLQPEQYPDIIYIDPMHPVRKKSALVKKDMQMLQQLLGTEASSMELILLAQQSARERVVVKWPQHQLPLLPPNASVAGKTIRFDMYRCFPEK